jgi:hypothetical protein
LYRDRGDCENAFDELKKQWGWGGFTTHDLKRCRLLAGSVALIFNSWSLFVRLADPDRRPHPQHLRRFSLRQLAPLMPLEQPSKRICRTPCSTPARPIPRPFSGGSKIGQITRYKNRTDPLHGILRP